MVQVDSRQLDDRLRAATRGSDPALRTLALTGIARLHDLQAVPLLRAGLRDPVPSVRDAAALGLGALEREAPAGTSAALLGQLATEADPVARGERLWDLGRVADAAADAALGAGLTAPDPHERAGACLGLGAGALGGRPVEAATVVSAASLAESDPDVGVRRACAYAVGRTHGRLDDASATAVGNALEAAARDPDEDVRALAVRALAARDVGPVEALSAAASDTSYRVALAAIHGLASRSTVEAHSAFLAALAALVGAAGGRALEAPRDLPLLVALEEAQAVATAPDLLPVAESFFAARTTARHRARLDALVHCRAAVLVDIGHGWPARARTCGLGALERADRDEAVVAVLAHVTGDAGQRAAQLRRVFDEGGVRGREAAVGAAAAVADPGADALLLLGFSDPDVGVVSAALEAAPAAATRLRPDGTPLPARVRTALVRAERTLAATDEVEGLAAWLDLVAALHASQLEETVRALESHACRAVRDRAVAALGALGRPRGSAPPRPVSNVIRADALLAAHAEVTATITLDGGGAVELALLADEAPTTVARFVARARAGAFDGTTFHRVVPGFVAQGGDPRGDGFGGPGWTQRCEDGRTRYERGVVGMALAGRDTGGSQFFITTGPAYHLDGRYTAFGRVVSGMERVDALVPGERIAHVTVAGEGLPGVAASAP